ncbi:MAG: hypothetical protein NTV23_15675 [Propionibacteriales bacterium]|nr:hypothetical protein [Propionibacteriales bacterium]
MPSGPCDVVTPCRPDPRHCTSLLPGHNLHTVRSTLAGQAPRQWQTSTVEEINGLVLTLLVAGDPGPVLAWHHRPLERQLAPGDQVRLHHSQGLIEVGRSWLSVIRSSAE